jgi:phage terminase large subunit GpA-like protein
MKILTTIFRMMAPPPHLSISEWSDQKRYLSSESSAEPGRWDTARAEYQRGIMDAISDPNITTVVCAKGTQVGWTEMLNNTVGFFIDQDPSVMLMIQPTIELAEAWSKDRLAPMIRDTPVINAKVAEAKSRDGDNTLRQKIFTGGRLTIIGANAPAGLAARPVRIVLADEVDRYPESAGTEGDPLALAAKRQQTFWNRKTLIGSTPLHLETSVVWREWLKSDMRRFMVPCPDCASEQFLKWAQVRWDKDERGRHRPETAHYVCEHCGSLWSDIERWDAIAQGHWQPTRKVDGVAGFHVPGMLSSWLSLTDIVKEFLAARKDPFLLQVWTNTVLGDPWEEPVEKIEGAGLVGRGENYGPDSLPDGVRLLTAGIDTQADRLELQVVGWGAHDESWVADYVIIHGDPAQPDVWNTLDKLLLKPYHTDTGRELRIRIACVDSGGHHANQVLAFCRKRHKRRVFATKGAPTTGLARPIWPARTSRAGFKGAETLYSIGTDVAKDVVYGRLRIPKPGPGYVHFPIGKMFDAEYFDQLTSEHVVTRRKFGKAMRLWVLPSGRKNEALDTMVLCLAARMSAPVRLDIVPVAVAAPRLPDMSEQEPQDLEPANTPPPVKHPIAPRIPTLAQNAWMGDRGRDWFYRR